MATQKISTLLAWACLAAMGVFIFLFLVRNSPGLATLPLFIALGAGYFLVFARGTLQLASNCLSAVDTKPGFSFTLHRLVLALLSALLIYIFLDNAVLDYYQPLSLHDDAAIALALCWSLLILMFFLVVISPWAQTTKVQRSALLLATIAVAGWPLTASLKWVNAFPVGGQVSIDTDIFVGGVDAYDVYRIPALLVLRKGSQLGNGEVLAQDVIIAMAEARRDGALDTGAIDLVMKRSIDGGRTWTQQQLLCQYKRKGERGKCGNPTPVFDRSTGQIFLAYNLSGIPGGATQRTHSSWLMVSENGGNSWGAPIKVADDNLVFGPGHGIQKSRAPHAGRLLIPAYVTEHAIVLYSDDHGDSWQRSAGLNTGNETELAELSDGQVYLTTRHRARIGKPPEPNGRLFSISSDGGQTWPRTQTDTQLPTPVCQASVAGLGDAGGLLFSNPNHPKARVAMSIQYSADDGRQWTGKIPIYAGPAGYSALGVMSNGDAVLAYERGAMSYSERISFARVPAEDLQ